MTLESRQSSKEHLNTQKYPVKYINKKAIKIISKVFRCYKFSFSFYFSHCIVLYFCYEFQFNSHAMYNLHFYDNSSKYKILQFCSVLLQCCIQLASSYKQIASLFNIFSILSGFVFYIYFYILYLLLVYII